jgi:hypothetical protein
MSMIVPLALPSTQRMQIVQQILETDHNAWHANYAWRPGKLFDTANRALTVFIIRASAECRTYSTFIRNKMPSLPRHPGSETNLFLPDL